MEYYIVLTIVFLLLTFSFNFWLNKIEDQNVSSLENKKNMGPIRPKISKFREAFKKTKVKAIENVGMRFTIIKRLVFLLWVLLFVVLIFFPTFTKTSKTTISLLASASTVLLGIASRQLIENIISGVVITFSKQFNIGDTVMIGETYGMVEDISYNEDLNMIKELAVNIADNSPFKKKDEHHSYFWIMEMGEKGVKCWVSAMTDSPANGWDFKTDVRTKLCLKFCELGIKPHLTFASLEGKDIKIHPGID